MVLKSGVKWNSLDYDDNVHVLSPIRVDALLRGQRRRLPDCADIHCE
jgi:hypothetical protein